MQKHSEQIKDDIATLFDLGITIGTLGTYAAGKTIITEGSKIVLAMTIDFVFQASIISLDSEQDFTNIRFSDVVWSGANSIIKNPYLSVGESTVRAGVLSALESTDVDFEKRLLISLKVARNELIVGIITYGTVGNSHYLKLLEKTFEKNPKAVYDSLIKLGISPENIKSISNSFVNNSLKVLINSYT